MKFFKSFLIALLTKIQLIEFESLIKQSIWSICGNGISKLLMLTSSIILARIMSQSDYGELGIIKSTINMFVVFAGFGIGNTTSRYIALYKKSNITEAKRIFDVSLFFIIVIGLIFSLSVFYFSDQIAFFSFNQISLSYDLKICSVVILFSTINGCYAGGLAGFQDFKRIAKNTFFSTIFQAVLSVIGGFYFSVSGALFGYIVGYFVLFLLHKKAISQKFENVQQSIKLKEIISTDFNFLYSFGIPAALSSFLVTPVFWWTKAFLVRQNNFSEMALYDVSDQWRLFILFIPSALIPIVLPSLITYKHKFRETLKFNIVINLSSTIFLILILSIFSNQILLAYGDNYLDTRLFIILISSTIFSSLSSVVGSSIASLGLMWFGFGFNLLWSFYMIIFTVYFVNIGYGAIGLAYALFLSYFIHSISQLVFLKYLRL